ncbi:MAG: aminotransferase class I/II-fold pyridoxal phosphate-dependent enzyme [Candidatus Omnitrophica bacterium]|nr:aminotransferase class I/II-fold pyridoxal phosphate-dependent enzyme [Candidatus Omnitrophota bacterium]
MHEANRMRRLPLYLFTIIDDLKAKARARGIDIIDLGMGNPDLPTPGHIIDELCSQVRINENHRYSRPGGDAEKTLKQAIAQWYKQRFNVDLDAGSEVLPLIGSKEGIAHLSLAFLNQDDIALVPNPAYPVHFNGVIMAGGILYNIPMTIEHNFKPDLKALSPEVVRMAKLLFISYPHNPTTAVADKDFFRNVLEWVKDKPGLIVAHDLAYSDIVFDGFKATSIMEIEGAKGGNVIEFHTLSKSYNMAGWRIGFVVGNRDILGSLAKTKSYVDFGIFRAIQFAAAKALTGPQDCVKELVETYRRRRDLFVDGLNAIGWPVEKPKATFYIWAHIPPKYSALTSMEFASLLIEEAGVAVAPGTGFGEYGEGYVRFALVDKEERLKTAIERIDKFLKT